MTTTEKDYTAVEHMVMALMFAVGEFRSILLPRKFVILTLEENFPLFLQHMDVSACISKWLVRLQEFEYTVQVKSLARANLAGLLTCKCYKKKLKVKPIMVKVEEEVSKLGEAHSFYFDGTYKRKVDHAIVGVVIYDEEGREVFGNGLMLENVHSNNEVEYAPLILGLEWCLNLGIKFLNAFGDALLLVKQVHGTWACRNQGLVVRLRRVKELLKARPGFTDGFDAATSSLDLIDLHAMVGGYTKLERLPGAKYNKTTMDSLDCLSKEHFQPIVQFTIFPGFKNKGSIIVKSQGRAKESRGNGDWEEEKWFVQLKKEFVSACKGVWHLQRMVVAFMMSHQVEFPRPEASARVILQEELDVHFEILLNAIDDVRKQLQTAFEGLHERVDWLQEASLADDYNSGWKKMNLDQVGTPHSGLKKRGTRLGRFADR
ncbi:hypothetical protein L7F22_023484 [Adiantum nelumboides]|nr:hypothetical protein [Adiantum nelumboides]